MSNVSHESHLFMCIIEISPDDAQYVLPKNCNLHSTFVGRSTTAMLQTFAIINRCTLLQHQKLTAVAV